MFFATVVELSMALRDTPPRRVPLYFKWAYTATRSCVLRWNLRPRVQTTSVSWQAFRNIIRCKHEGLARPRRWHECNLPVWRGYVCWLNALKQCCLQHIYAGTRVVRSICDFIWFLISDGPLGGSRVVIIPEGQYSDNHEDYSIAATNHV